MVSNEANIQRLDQLLEQVLSGNGPALRPTEGGSAASLEMAANVQVAQLFRSTLAAMPSNEAKNRARARLHEAAAVPAPTPWWQRWSPRVIVRGMAAASAAVIVALVASQASVAPDAEIASLIGTPPATAENAAAEHVAAAEGHAEQSFILAQAGDGAAAIGAVSELTRLLALATQAISEVGSVDRDAAGISRLVASADGIMSSLESGAAKDDAASEIGLIYAEAIESVANGSPAILGIGGKLQISTAGLTLDRGDGANALQVSAFRVDSSGGTWESAWTTTSMEDGTLEVELPSGTYTRVRFTTSADSGPSVMSEVPRPFAISTDTTSHIAPPTLVWEPTVDDEPTKAPQGHGVASGQPKAGDGAGDASGSSDSVPVASAPPAQSSPAEAGKGKQGKNQPGDSSHESGSSGDQPAGAASGVAFDGGSDDAPGAGDNAAEKSHPSQGGKATNTTESKPGKGKNAEPEAAPLVVTSPADPPAPNEASGGDNSTGNDSQRKDQKPQREGSPASTVEPTEEPAHQQPVVAHKKNGKSPKNEPQGHQEKGEPDSLPTPSLDDDDDDGGTTVASNGAGKPKGKGAKNKA